MDDRPRSSALTAGKWLLALAAAAVVVYVILARPQKARALAVPAHEAAAAPAPETAPAPATPSAAARAEARRARDAMRAQILAALRHRDTEDARSEEPFARAAAPVQASAASPAAPAPADPGAEEPPHGRYEPSYIQKTFREHMMPILKQCYTAALARQPALGGRLVLEFSIVGDHRVGGVVEDASIADESDLVDEEMETCARESLLAMTFDKPPSGGGLVKVTYPILFSPGDDEESPAGAAPAR